MKVKCVVAFIFGAAVGSVASWALTKRKYERKADEEIESMRSYYSERFISNENEVVEKEPDVKESIIPIEELKKEYSDIVDLFGYAKNEEKGGESNMGMDGPYVISPEEFDEKDGYEIRSFTFYADGVLEDENQNVIDDKDIEKLIGIKSLDCFGEYEEDSVFVRNDELKTDFEILYDMSKYSEIYHQDSHSVDE